MQPITLARPLHKVNSATGRSASITASARLSAPPPAIQPERRVMMPLRTGAPVPTSYGDMPSHTPNVPLSAPLFSSGSVVSPGGLVKARELSVGYGTITTPITTPIASARVVSPRPHELSPRPLSSARAFDRQTESMSSTYSLQSRQSLSSVAPLAAARIRHKAPGETRPSVFPQVATTCSAEDSFVKHHDHPICIVEVTVTEENRARFLELMKALIAPSQEELGCLRYELWQVRDVHPPRYTLFEEWRSHDDLHNHKQTKHFLKFAPEIFKIADCIPTRLKPVDVDQEFAEASEAIAL